MQVIAQTCAAAASLTAVATFIAGRTTLTLWVTEQKHLIARVLLAEKVAKEAAHSLEFAGFTRAEAEHLRERVESNEKDIESLRAKVSGLTKHIAALAAWTKKLEITLQTHEIPLPKGKPKDYDFLEPEV
jgi:uncharacterized protein YlxW (UPF0749 family)